MTDARKYFEQGIYGEGGLLPTPTREGQPLMLIGADWYWGKPDSYAVNDCDADDAANACRVKAIMWLGSRERTEPFSACAIYEWNMGVDCDEGDNVKRWGWVVDYGNGHDFFGDTLDDALIKAIAAIKSLKGEA